MELADVQLEPCDIGFVSGRGLFSRSIAGATRSPGELPTQATHVFLVDRAGTFYRAELLEASWRVRRGTIGSFYAGGTSQISIARPRNLTSADRELILRESRRLEGLRYAWWKLFPHLIDGVVFRGSNVLRRFGGGDRPICSYHVARAYGAAGYTFGIDSRAATPDDIWDFCAARGDRYVWPIGRHLRQP